MKDRIILMISIILLFSCDNKSSLSRNSQINEISKTQISSREVERFDKDNFLYIIRFSNLIYEVKGKKVKIPIFQGKYGDVLYADFKKYCRENKILDNDAKETGFIIQAKKGELKKTLHDFLKFYKSNILLNIDIEKTTRLLFSGDEEKFCEWEIYYDFEVEGIPFVLKIIVKASKEDFANKAKRGRNISVFSLDTDERMKNPHFIFSIYSDLKTEGLFYR